MGNFFKDLGNSVTKFITGDAWKYAATTGMYISYDAYKAVVKAMMPKLPGMVNMRTDRELMTNGATTPRRIIYGTCRVSGQIAYLETSGVNHEYLHLIVLLAGRPVTGFGDIYLDDKLLATFGANASAQLFDGTQTTACAAMVAASAANNAPVTTATTGNTVDTVARIGGLPSVSGLFAGMAISGDGIDAGTTITYVGDTYVDISAPATATASGTSFSFTGSPQRWTVDHKLIGCAYIYLKLTYKEGLFTSGLPKVAVVVHGTAVYDPRTTLTAYSNNPALCIRDYMLLGEELGGMGCASAEIDDASVITAADICDESVVRSLDGTLFEPRYQCDGSISVEGTPKSIVDALLQSMVGEAVYSGGTWKLYAGAYTSPVATLDESWLNGDINFTVGSSKSDRINTIKGSFIDPTASWAAKEFPVLTSAAYIAADGGEELAADLKLNFTTSITTAQRIAKIFMEQSRIGNAITYPCNLKAFKLAPGDTVLINNTLLGWSEQIFKIAGWSFGVSGGVNLMLRQDDPAIYDWTAGEIIPLQLPPPTILPNPAILAAPTGLAVAETIYATLVQSIIKVKAVLSWNTHPVANRFIVSVDGVEVADVPGSVTQYTFMDIEQGAHVFSVAAVNIYATRSAAATLNYTVLGKLAAPSAVDTFLVAKQPDGTREFSWTHPSAPIDLAGYRIRYVSGSSGSWASMTELHSGLLLASPFESNQLAAGEYTFAICAEDTSGVLSAATYITLTLADPRMAGVALSASFGALGWGGTKTDCYVDDLGQLVAAGSKDWADFAIDGVTWADWLAWNRAPVSPIVYEHTPLDIGAVTLFTPLVSVTGDGTPTVTVSYSSDGSTYSAFAAIPATPITARYIKVKVSQAGADPTLRAVIVYLSAQQITEEINDYTPASGDFRLPIAKTYAVIQTVQLTLQNVGAGWSWELIDKNAASGPRVKIYDSSNTLAAAVIDASVKGL